MYILRSLHHCPITIVKFAYTFHRLKCHNYYGTEVLFSFFHLFIVYIYPKFLLFFFSYIVLFFSFVTFFFFFSFLLLFSFSLSFTFQDYLLSYTVSGFSFYFSFSHSFIRVAFLCCCRFLPLFAFLLRFFFSSFIRDSSLFLFVISLCLEAVRDHPTWVPALVHHNANYSVTNCSVRNLPWLNTG